MIPETKEEYERLFHQNQRVSGFGTETTVHMPCGFCAAPDWKVFRVIDSHEALAGDAHCETCKRTVRGTVTRTHDEVSISMVLIQGDDPPPWMPMPRASV